MWKSASPLASAGVGGGWGAAWGIAAGLALLVLAAFWPVVRCRFVDFDDDFYITGNPMVRSGIHWATVRWAVTHTAMGLYHPLTILSLALDAQGEKWFGHGLTAGAFHVENLLLHGVNTMVLYLVMWRMTGCRWRSALAVGLWAVHPLRVESVAWIVERKDELAGLFGFLAIGMYVSYARRGSAWRYAGVLVLLVLSLLAKPMMVTLPAGLVLLDVWPLRRLGDKAGMDGRTLVRAAWLLAEKLPMVMIIAADVHVGDVLRTLEAGQSPRSTFAGMGFQSLAAMGANALAVLPMYLQKMLDFRRLTVFYPKEVWSAGQIALGGAVLIALTAAALWQGRRRPWLTVGWLWFLVMLAPALVVVMGLEFSMADRYTYLPSIGLCVMAAWSVPAEWGRDRYRGWLAAGVLFLLLQLSIWTWTQCTYWTNSEQLWTRCISAAGDNWLAEGNLAAALDGEGRGFEAMDRYKQAVALNDSFVGGHMNLGRIESTFHDVADAAGQFRRVTELDPLSADGWYKLGFEYADPSTAEYWMRLGRPDTDSLEKLYRLALPAFDRASILAPGDAQVAFARAETLLALHRPDEAMAAFRQAIADDPTDSKAHNELGVALALSGNYAAAADEFRAAIRIWPGYKEARANLLDAEGHLGNATRPG